MYVRLTSLNYAEHSDAVFTSFREFLPECLYVKHIRIKFIINSSVSRCFEKKILRIVGLKKAYIKALIE